MNLGRTLASERPTAHNFEQKSTVRLPRHLGTAKRRRRMARNAEVSGFETVNKEGTPDLHNRKAEIRQHHFRGILSRRSQ
jgi:hypothetical protein